MGHSTQQQTVPTAIGQWWVHGNNNNVQGDAMLRTTVNIIYIRLLAEGKLLIDRLGVVTLLFVVIVSCVHHVSFTHVSVKIKKITIRLAVKTTNRTCIELD